jgi:hypothetical protein
MLGRSSRPRGIVVWLAQMVAVMPSIGVDQSRMSPYGRGYAAGAVCDA